MSEIICVIAKFTERTIETFYVNAREREREIDTERERDRQTDRQRETERETERERQRERDREREGEKNSDQFASGKPFRQWWTFVHRSKTQLDFNN